LTVQQTIELEYPHLVEAAKRITGNSELHLDLLHYSIEELYKKPNMKDIIDSGGLRFYLVRIMQVQWRSRTGPFFKQFGDHWHREIPQNLIDETEEHLDVEKVKRLLSQLNWYDTMLFQTFVDGNHTYSSLSRDTGIPRTSISLTVNRVREYIKQNLYI
jgi:hypothetical protein